MIYNCECGKQKELLKTTIKVIDGKVEVAEALCECGKYMDSEPIDGMPSLIRTEPSLTKKFDHTKKR
jgi:hypothetical protein